MNRFATSMRVVVDCTVLACALGVALDLVTAHVAVEYFTIHHPKVVESTSPLVMALVWGVGAAWWFGAVAGGIVAFENSRRSTPLSPTQIRRVMASACALLWCGMMVILATAYGLIGLIPLEKRRPSFGDDRRIMAVALTHMTEYALGSIALVVVCLRVRNASNEQGTSSRDPQTS